MRKLKVLLTPILNQRKVEEIGICYISAYLRHLGYEVLLLAYCEGDKGYYEKVNGFKPDVIGITVYNSNKEQAYCMLKKLNYMFPEAKLGIGQYEVTSHL